MLDSYPRAEDLLQAINANGMKELFNYIHMYNR